MSLVTQGESLISSKKCRIFGSYEYKGIKEHSREKNF